MISRAGDAGIPSAWVAGDEVYGGNPKLRARLGEAGIPCVTATACSGVIPMAAGGIRADEAPALVPRGGWQRLSCAAAPRGRGCMTGRSSGPRRGPGITCWRAGPCRRARRAPLSWRSSAAGRPARSRCPNWRRSPARWGIEDCSAGAKGEAGPDRYQVRRYRAWYRHAPWPCSPMSSSPSPYAPPDPADDAAAPAEKGA